MIISSPLSSSSGWTTRHSAAAIIIVDKEDQKLTEALHYIEGDINAFHESEEGDANLLFVAAEYDNRPAFEALLKMESLDVTKVNEQGKNVLHIMAQKDRMELAKLCFEKLEGQQGDILKKFVNCSTKTGKGENFSL